MGIITNTSIEFTTFIQLFLFLYNFYDSFIHRE